MGSRPDTYEPNDTFDVPIRDLISQNMRNKVNLLDHIGNLWMKKQCSLASKSIGCVQESVRYLGFPK